MIVDGRYEDPVIRKVDGRRKRRKSGEARAKTTPSRRGAGHIACLATWRME
jgi:hypothetical protein